MIKIVVVISKIVVVILLMLVTLACDPIQQGTQKDQHNKPKTFTCLTSQSECDINTELGLYTIQFSGQVEQGRIKTELPFVIQLQFTGSKQAYQLKSLSSYLEGKDMFMGKIPMFFQRDQKMANTMVAETLLASCSEEIMTWRLWFQVAVSYTHLTLPTKRIV